ncbi:MAG: hypothetical protein EXQ70_09330 [Solirubrobacterales bacterium]|nr:hypothetical protein [Solirubrobacterales bacterium]
MPVLARNLAIVALLALGVTVLPSGDAVVNTVLAAISLAFLAVIAAFVYRMYREQQLTLLTLSDGRRAMLFGAVGIIALLVAGTDEMLRTGTGALAWISLMALAAGTIFVVWRDATSY